MAANLNTPANPDLLADAFRRAFQLAYFIHQRRAVSLEIATAALAKVEVAATAQVKRLYYRPVGQQKRPNASPARTKISMDDLPLLQRLVYIESEPYERQTEDGPRPAGQADLTVRFIKHLVQITVRRNSFHVALGVGRLLHNYSTADTLLIHDTLLADPDRAKGEDYCRARKALLLQELERRFGRRISTTRGPRGEERFDAEPTTPESAELVAESLDEFTPWGTPCVPPATYNDQASDENRIEVNRMHSILHPECYRRITGDLHLDPPEKRLEIPRFAGVSHAGGKGSDDSRNSPPEVSDDDLSAAAASLAAEAARRKRASSGLLRIVVDGTERERLDPASNSVVRLELGEEAEFVEVRTSDDVGDLLLACCLLHDEGTSGGRAPARSVILEAGQQFSFLAWHHENSTGAPRLTVEVGYRETRLIRAAASLLRRWQRRLTAQPIFRPAPGLALLAFLAIGLTIWFRTTRPSGGQAARTEQKPITPREGAATSEASPAIASKGPPVTRQPDTVIAGQVPRHVGTSEKESTRGLHPASPRLTLSGVRRVFVDCPDSIVHDALVRELRATERFAVAEKQDDADAAFQVLAIGASGENKEQEVTVRMTGPAGDTLWPARGKRQTQRYRGSPREMATRAVRDLMSAVESDRPKP